MSLVLQRTRMADVVALLGGLGVVLPLILLEWATASSRPRSGFAFPLFVVLWILAVVFIGTAVRAVQAVRTRGRDVITPMWLLTRIGVLAVVGWTWLSWVVDQMPCFLGASGC